MTDAFTWTTDETFQVVNVLTGTEERYENARWHIIMWLYPEDSLRELLDDVPLAEPIDLDKVDWSQVCEVLADDIVGPPTDPEYPSKTYFDRREAIATGKAS
jgi:hypothetical protein